MIKITKLSLSKMSGLRSIFKEKIREGDRSIANLVFDAIKELDLVSKIAENISKL